MEQRSAARKGGFSGSLQEKPLEGILYNVALQAVSAEIELKHGDIQRALFVRQGKVIYASSTVAAETLSYYLIRNSLVTAKLADEMRKRSSQTDVLIDVMKADPPVRNLKQTLEMHTGQQAVACFAMTAGEFQFLPLPKSLATVELPALDPLMLIHQGIKTAYSKEILEPKFAKILDRKLLCAPAFTELYARFAFSPAEQELLKRIDAKTSIGELCVAPGLDQIGALRLIWTLFSLRMVGMVQTADSKREKEERLKPEVKASVVAAPLPVEVKEEVVPIDPKQLRQEIEEKFLTFEKETFFDLLRVGRKDSPAKIKKAYLDLAKRYHPDALVNLGLGDLTKQAGSVFARMTEAHDALVNPDKRKEYEASLDIDPEVLAKVNDIIKAETEFQKGEIMLRNRSHDAALRQFEMALQLNPEEAEHHVYAAWARYLCAPASRKTEAMGEAKKAIQKGLALRGNVDMAYVFLGRMAKSTNDNAEAEKCFRKAIQLNANNDQAVSELHAMERKR